MSKNNTTFNAEYNKWKNRWELIRDFIEGDDAVKAKGTQYLPKPMAHDHSEANTLLYNQLKERAYVIGFTGRTSQALLGQSMFKAPEVQLHPAVEYLTDDADGNGLGLNQLARQVASETIDVSRCGLLVDFPQSEDGVSARDIANGVRPYIKIYSAESIVDWKERKFGAITRLASVKLVESSPRLDEFGFETGHNEDIERILFIDDQGVYRQRVRASFGSKVLSEEIITPLNGSGQPFNYIPFQFVGSESNTSSVDKPILYDMAILNRGQYRNAADDENAAFKLGNPMTVLKTNALPEDIAGGGFVFGSDRAAIVGVDDDVVLIQADPNTISIDRMDRKIDQAQKIGARLIIASKQQTAEAARIDQGSEVSVLSTINSNVSEAITNTIDWCEDFMTGAISGDSFLSMTQEFFFSKMTAQDRQVWMADVQAGNVPRETYWAALRETRAIDETMTDEKLAEMLDNAAPDLAGAFDVEEEEPEASEE